MATHCPTVFLDEETAPDFPPHRRVVDSLANLIASTRGGRVLSLVGPYGSGKTTIVRRLQEKFDAERPPQKHLFLFDAWAHRGEVLRRAFIVKLTEFLAQRGLLSADDQKRVERVITRMPDVAAGTTAPKYALIAGLFAVLGMLISPALTMIGKAGVPFDVNLYGALALCIGLFAGATFLGRTVSVTETRRGSDLSSLEFQTAFTTAINQTFLRRPDARIVIAFDDLDRIGEKDVSEVITALRIFLAAEHDVVDFRRLWFIVPFDRDAMQKTLGEHALEKLFALRIDVPPPNLPNGLETFETRFLQAFPNHTRLEAQEAHSLFGFESFRALNTFINRVALLHASWCGKIPLVDLAAYVMSEGSSSTGRPGGTPDYEGWQRRVAALDYNVPEEEVAYVPKAEGIEQALDAGDGTRLLALSSTPAFAQTVYRVITENRATMRGSPERVANAALAMNALGGDARFDQIWLLLLVIAKSVDAWPPDKDFRGLGLLLSKAPPANRQAMARTALQSLVEGIEKKEEKGADVWLENYKAIVQAMGDELPVEVLTPIGGSPWFRVEILRFIDEGLLKYAASPPIDLSNDAALRDLVATIAAGSNFTHQEGALARLIGLGKAWSWIPTLQRSRQLIGNAGRLIEVFLMIERHAQSLDATQLLDEYASDGTLLRVAIQARGYTHTAAVALAALASRDPKHVTNVVEVVSVDKELEEAGEKIMAFLTKPAESLLSEIEAVLHRNGVLAPARELLPELAKTLESKGGIRFTAAVD